MPPGQYFRKVAKSLKVVRANLKILSAEKRDTMFQLEVPRAKRAEMVQYFIDLGASTNLREVPAFLLEAVSKAFGQGISCTECGESTTFFSEYECGHRYARCEAHYDEVLDDILDAHMDHECSLACCARGHTGEYRSIRELEALVAPVEIFVREEDSSPRRCFFTVRLHHKTGEERARELEYLMMNCLVKEFRDATKSTIRFDLPPLMIGMQTRITPTFLSRPLVTLAVVRHGEPLHGEVVACKPNGQYVCRLPKGVTIPAHSWMAPDGTYLTELCRSELEVTET